MSGMGVHRPVLNGEAKPREEEEPFSEGFWAGRMSDRSKVTGDQRELAYQAYRAGERWNNRDSDRRPLQERVELRALPFDAWHEDDHDVLWWHFPIHEPPYCGSPIASDWPFGVGDESALGWTRFAVPVSKIGVEL
jgi:hypothetical protein